MDPTEGVELEVMTATLKEPRIRTSACSFGTSGRPSRSCEFCAMTFKARATLYKHLLKQHPEEWSLKQIKKQMERRYQCKFCHCKFRYKNNLSCHLKREHKSDLILGGYYPENEESKRRICQNFCKEEGCDASFSSVEQLKRHLTSIHFIEMESAQITFKRFSDFEEWRKDLESRTTRFMPRMKWSRADGGFTRFYKCMRSGVYAPTVSEENRKRRLKSEGSYKIGQHCPAQLTVVNYPSGTTVVKACLTHYGHEFNGKYALGYNKNKDKGKQRNISKENVRVIGADDIQEQNEDVDHEVLTSSLATKENLRDQAKDLCGFLQGLLTTAEGVEDNLEQIIFNLNQCILLAGWKPVQDSKFVPIDVVKSVRRIEAQEAQENPYAVHRLGSDTSKYKHSQHKQEEVTPKLEQQEVVQEYLITEAPYEQYIVWS